MGTIYQCIGRQERDCTYIPQQEPNYEAARQQIATDGLPKQRRASLFSNGEHIGTLSEPDAFDEVAERMAYTQTMNHVILEILPGARIPDKPAEE